LFQIYKKQSFRNLHPEVVVSEQMLSVGEAARRLGVKPVTVQRWVDAGNLSALRTVGGHRRIPATEVRRLLADNRSVSQTGQLSSWVDQLFEADAVAIAEAMRRARRRKGSWYAVVEELVAAVSEIGAMWEAGECRVYQEHAASEALKRAIHLCLAKHANTADQGLAVLFTVPGERHSLGLSLAQLVVADADRDILWLGDGPPEDELHLLVEDRRPDVLVTSCSGSSPRALVEPYEDALLSVAKTHKVGLVLAGAGPWSERSQAHRVASFAEFHDALAKLGKTTSVKQGRPKWRAK
jgi:excisionase family DNA binding protein